MILEPTCGDVMAKRIQLALFSLLVALSVCPMEAVNADQALSEKPTDSQSADTPDAKASDAGSTERTAEPEPIKKPTATVVPLAPEKYRDVDDAAKLLIWLVVSCGLGLLVLLCVIVLGAKRMRRLTQSKSLKSKYDELEFLRLKHRREADGLPAPDEPKTEIR